MSINDTLAGVTIDQVTNELNRRSRDDLLLFIQRSFRDYQAGWVHVEICKRLEQFERDLVSGKRPRLMLFMPPRHGKSFIASQRFPAWFLGRNPTSHVVVASYSQELSNTFSRNARGLVEDEWFGTPFPDAMISKERSAVQEWVLTKGGGFKSVGVGGGLTGSGANLFIIDDPVKGYAEAYSDRVRQTTWDWFQSVAQTRFAPNYGLFVIMTRWHHDDLAGRLLEENPDAWDVIRFPAIAEKDEPHRKEGEVLHPERFAMDFFEPMKENRRVWTALYQQRPTLEEGGLFKLQWFQFYTVLPSVEYYIWSWDTAIEQGKDNDYSVGQFWAVCQNGFYLVDQVRDKLEYPELKRRVQTCFDKQPARQVIIEKKASGQQLIQDFKRSTRLPIRPVTPGTGELAGDKVARANIVSPLFEAGRVYLPEGAPWVDDYIQELIIFPNAPHDDQVDATTQCLTVAQREASTLSQSGVWVPKAYTR